MKRDFDKIALEEKQIQPPVEATRPPESTATGAPVIETPLVLDVPPVGPIVDDLGPKVKTEVKEVNK